MKALLAATILASAFVAGPALAAPSYSDDEIMAMTALEWAGMNCGTMISEEDYWRALRFTKGIEPKQMQWYRKRLRATLSAAATHEIACKSVLDVFTEAGRQG